MAKYNRVYNELDDKMIKFIENYIITGGNALASAKAAEYKNPASAAIRLTAEDSIIWDYIKKYDITLNRSGVMGQNEVLQRITNIGRGKATAKVPMTVGVGDGMSDVIQVEVTPSIAEQLTALKILQHIYGLDKGITESSQTSGVIIQIEGADKLED